MTENFQKGDWIRVSYESQIEKADGYYTGRLVLDCAANEGRLRNLQTELIEKVDHPKNDLPGTFRRTQNGYTAVKVRPNIWYLLDDQELAPCPFHDSDASGWTRIDPVTDQGSRKVRKLIEPNGDVWFELTAGSGRFTWTGTDGSGNPTPATAARYTGAFRDLAVDEIVREVDMSDRSELMFSWADDDR